MDSMEITPMMENELFDLVVRRIMPARIELQIYRTSKRHPTLLAFVQTRVLGVLSGEAYFLVGASFDFIGFRQYGEDWKAEYQIGENVTCTVCDGDKKVSLEISEDVRDFLVLIMKFNELPVIAFDIPPIEVALVPQRGGRGQDLLVPTWRFVRQ
jgi:hypothetical protein